MIASLLSRLPGFYRVRGTSMAPLLKDGQLVRVRRAPAVRDALVAFRAADGIDVKRVVALPGETVEIQGDRVLINGRDVARAFAKERRLWKLRAGEYFVLGDNHESSRDSRDTGPVSAERILGVVTQAPSRAAPRASG